MGVVALIDNLLSLVIVNVTFTAPSSVWPMWGFFGSIPAGIEEEASVDGAGRMRTLFSIVLPLTATGVAAAAIFSFVWSWTEYRCASAFIVDEANNMLPVGLGAFIAQYNVDWGILTAAAMATALPEVVALTHRLPPAQVQAAADAGGPREVKKRQASPLNLSIPGSEYPVADQG